MINEQITKANSQLEELQQSIHNHKISIERNEDNIKIITQALKKLEKIKVEFDKIFNETDSIKGE